MIVYPYILNQRKMELVEDFKQIIVSKLGRKIVTLIDKKRRDLYFRKKGIKNINHNKLIKYINSDLFKKYNISWGLYMDDTVDNRLKLDNIPETILNNITNVKMDDIFNLQEDFIQKLPNLKRLSFWWNDNLINSKELIEKIAKIELKIYISDNPTQSLVDFLTGRTENNRPKLYVMA